MLIERLSRLSGLSRSQLEHYADTASRRYKTYEIDKRDGGKREISQPSKPVKALQRWLNRAVFQTLPVHAAATAYVKGASIRENASRHSQSNFTLRIDFKNFFPSFSAAHVERYLVAINDEQGLGLSSDDILFVAKVVSRRGALTIGAPSSPILTNAMMHDFDSRLSTWSKGRGVIYSRYADDLFLSAREPERLAGAMEHVAELGNAYSFGTLRINPKKTVFLTRRARRSVTGLVITTDRRVSVGRLRKREVQLLIHLQKKGVLDLERREYLRGMLAFVSDVEPSFRNALNDKFGAEFLAAVGAGYSLKGE